MHVIRTAVADLRAEPKEILSKDFSHDDLRESQLLFAESVSVIRQEGEWLYVKALEQSDYPGWLHQSELLPLESPYPANLVVCAQTAQLGSLTLSYGTYLHGDERGNIILPDGRREKIDPQSVRPIPKQLDRNQLIQEALSFLDLPYLWGGRAAHLTNPVASVDCSGLINLLYRAQGIILPRNAHEQSLFGKKTSSFFPGDPIYLTKNGVRFNHVVLYLNADYCLESPQTGQCVRLLKWGHEITLSDGLIQIQGREAAHFVSCSFGLLS